MSSVRQRALVVDDDKHLRRLLEMILNLLEIDVVAEAGDGEAAIEKFRLIRPDIVLLDVIMPTLSGIQVLEKIHEIDPKARVVVLTRDDGFEAARQSMALGAMCYIRKSNSAQEIYRLLAECLGVPGDE